MRVLSGLFLFLCCSALLLAQTPGAPPQSNQITPQVLGDMLRSATTFHDLVEKLNLKNSLGPDVHVPGPDGIPQHSVERTAATIGAGAGVGAAIGGMTHGQNGVLIGAFIGGAGGLIIDEILKHREANHPQPVYAAPPEGPAYPR